MPTTEKNGFSLVELLIVSAGLLGIAVVGMQISKSQNASAVKSKFDSDIILTTNEINAILSDPAKCLATLNGRNALSTTSGINAINSNKFHSVASGSAPSGGYGNSNLQITSYSLSATAAEVTGKNSTLLINYQNKDILRGTSGPATVTKKVNLFVEVDSSNNITYCRSLSTSSTDIWTRGSGSAIYYNGGNVGIGTNTPQVMMDVSGPIKAGNQTAGSSCTSAQVGSMGVDSITKKILHCGSDLVWANIDPLLKTKAQGSACNPGAESLAKSSSGVLLICH